MTSKNGSTTTLHFWWAHLRIPLAVFLILATVLTTSRLDIVIAQSMYFDTAQMAWIGAGNWWVEEVIHTGGRWLIRGLAALTLALWIATWIDKDLRNLRRPAGYFLVSLVLSIGTIGILKVVTNVDCPWDLAPFGGRFPFIELFADRPDALRQGRCFPAAHASSGYALLALYFVLRERGLRIAQAGLTLGAVTGLIFGIAQQSRGAHFVSHDVWSAFLVWTISLSLYTFAFKGQLWNTSRYTAAESAGHDRAVVATGRRLVVSHAVLCDGTGGLARPPRR